MPYICPKCRHYLTPVETPKLYSLHSVCFECRVVYITQGGLTTLCNNPKAHVPSWPLIPVRNEVYLPKIIPGPLSMGLL